MIELVLLGDYYGGKEDRLVEVEYVKDEDKSERFASFAPFYGVVVDGRRVGEINRVMASTDRHYNRIRVPGKGRPAWSWTARNGQSNYPGLYARSRAQAVAEMLGYAYGKRRKMEGR